MEEKGKISRLVLHLESLRGDDERPKNRAALARLRRGLGKKVGTPQMYPHVVPYVEDGKADIQRGLLVAALFALHDKSAPRGRSMGEVFRRMRDGSNDASLERRFTVLLSASAEDVGGHLRHAVSLAKAKDVPVDYDRLLHDLRYWSHADRIVQLAWARDFWTRGDSGDSPIAGDNTTEDSAETTTQGE